MRRQRDWVEVVAVSLALSISGGAGYLVGRGMIYVVGLCI